MNAYEKIYEALTQGKDEKWKKTVDETVKRFKSQGMTDLQAMKRAAMELNQEKAMVDLSGVFLKSYHTRNGESLFNILANGETIMVTGERDMIFPQHPTQIEIKEGEMVRNLMTRRTNLQITDDTEIKFGGPANPDAMMDAAREIMEVPGDEYGMIKGRVISLTTFKPKDQPEFEGILVTPDNTNLMLTMRSGTEWPKVFVRNLDVLINILPSPEDQAKFQSLCESQEWEKMVSYFNEMCAENRDYGFEGATVLAYGKITDRTWEDRKTGEERQSKNFNMSVGGFIYSMDLLYALLNPKSPEPKEEKPKKKKDEFEFKFDPQPQDDEPEAEGDEPPTPEPEPEVEAPEGDSVEETVLKLLEKKNGMTPQELVSAVGVTAEELAAILTGLHKNGKVQLKDAKFFLKRKK
jgi:hypothetical protein